MYLEQLKQQFSVFTPLIEAFAQANAPILDHYRRTYTSFQQQLPAKVAQSSLTDWLNDDIRGMVFDAPFSESIPEHLRNIRKISVRLDDYLSSTEDLGIAITEHLTAVIEQLDALCQKHWEWYRYQAQATDADLIELLSEMEQVDHRWHHYLSHVSGNTAVLEKLQPIQCPQQMQPLMVSYQQPASPAESKSALYSVEVLEKIIRFLNCAYQLVNLVETVEQPTPQPKSMAQPLCLIESTLSEQLRLVLAVPTDGLAVYTLFLQRLFLKDVLKQDSLVKVVCDSLVMKTENGHKPSPTTMTRLQKDLLASLKELPSEGIFQIQSLQFPQDNIAVLRDFVEVLKEDQINTAKLFGEVKKAASGKAAAARTAKQTTDSLSAAAGTDREPDEQTNQLAAENADHDHNGNDGFADPALQVPYKKYVNMLTES